jgi:transcriptional regulator with XRE-family HTH domain
MASAKVNAERLRREMLLRGWNGVDLAFRSGVSPATVSHAIRGLPISTTTIRKMALALSKAPVIDGAAELLA